MNVPDGWFDYSRFGSPIDSTRIVPIKTPLKEQFNTGRPAGLSGDYTKRLRGVPLEEEFTPVQMLEMFRERGWSVGLVIDLTYTHRYYNPQEFMDCDVQHTKILCPGVVIPPDYVYQQLSDRISDFLSDSTNDGKLVAVHCTHGLNRTGYLVCRYLMEKCGYDAEAAIEAFNKSRGSVIERENYLEHLRNGCPKEDDRQQSPAPNGLPQHVSISSGDGVRSVRERVVRGRGNSGGFERGMTDLRSKINNRRVHEDHGATSSRHDRSDGGGVRSRKRARCPDDDYRTFDRPPHHWDCHSHYMRRDHTPHTTHSDYGPRYHSRNDYRTGVDTWTGSHSHLGQRYGYEEGHRNSYGGGYGGSYGGYRENYDGPRDSYERVDGRRRGREMGGERRTKRQRENQQLY